MIEPNDLLLGGLLPAVAAAMVLPTVWKLTRHGGAAWSVSLAVGYLVGHWGLDASPDGHASVAGFWAAMAKSFKPHEARDWLPLGILLGAIPGVLASAGKKSRAIAWLPRAVLCGFLPWRLLVGSAYLPRTLNSKSSLPDLVFDTGAFDTRAWSNPEAVAWLGGIGAALFAIWIAAEAENEKTAWWLRGLLAAGVAFGGAVAVALSGSFTYGQLLGVLTASLAGSGLAAWMLPRERFSGTAAGPLVVAFGGALVLAHFFSELKLLYAGLLLVSMASAIGRGLPVARLSWRMQVVLRCLLCLIPLAVAVSMAALDFSATQAEAESNPYLNFRQ